MKSVVIAGYARSPFTFANKGALARARADDMVADVLRALVQRTQVKVEDIEDVPIGCAFPEGEQGFNIGRMAVLLADLPVTIGGMTINRFCGSSMQAIHGAVGSIACNGGEVFLAAGVESMSRVPMGGFNPMPNPDLYEKKPGAYLSMGETAENVAQKFKISREEQDAFALKSQKKAAAAQDAGHFKEEIVPLIVEGDVVDQDGCLRPATTLEALGGLKPAFDTEGTVTAGTASPLTDGAAAVLVCSEDYAQKNGHEPLARIKSFAVSGCEPEIMGIGPVRASQKALARAGLSMKDIDLVELNEAFASQVIACIRELEIDEAKLNIDGGAIALGHPLGATGARITGKAAALLKREKKKYALVTQCIGGGQGIATILEAL